MSKKSIVVVMDTYYPDSRATTYIMQRILEHISDLYDIHVITLDLLKLADYDTFPGEHNGISIHYAKLPSRKLSLKYFFLKLKSKLAMSAYEKKYGTRHQYDELYILSKQIRKLIADVEAKTLISVSTPADIHICAEMALKMQKKTDWFPVCFDPYAYNGKYTSDLREAYRKEELILYEKAKKIFMLSQAKQDYAKSILSEKTVFFELPVTERGRRTNPGIPQSRDLNRPAEIMYMGNLFNSIRNPDRMLDVFSEIKDMNIAFSVIGSFFEWGDTLSGYLERWTTKFDGKLKIIDRLSRDEAEKHMLMADFLVNLGNTTGNQCPSKVMEYISTGKPIIHFKKIANCSSLPYLEKYPIVCILDENDSKETNVSKLKEFIAENRGKTVDEATLNELYRENRYEYISGLFISQIGE